MSITESERKSSVPVEILVPSERILRHFLEEETGDNPARFLKIPADHKPTPVFSGDFYYANIGQSPEEPILLALRFEPISTRVVDINPQAKIDIIDEKARIALLMTNERSWLDLATMGEEIYWQLKQRGVGFDAIIAPDSLGPRIAQEIARISWLEEENVVLPTSFQKGKPYRLGENEEIHIGPPKEWINPEAGIPVNSGTSVGGSIQEIYLDQKIGQELARKKARVLIVDDARLFGGTIDAGLRLLAQFGIEVAGIATVLNEGPPVKQINEIPFVWLTKLPLFAQVKEGLQPIPNSYTGLEYFYTPTSY